MKKVVLVVVVVIACASAAAVTWWEMRPRQRNVLFLMMDTTRADHLGVYGYQRDTSPNLDAFARENVRFDYALSAAPWTPPSVATMFTGLYPASHGCVPPNGIDNAKAAGTKLNPDLLTLAEAFKGYGYTTAGVSSNPWITEEFGFSQGFDSFWSKPRAKAAEVNKAGKEVLDTLISAGRPFFVYMHYLDPHNPYEPPADLRDRYKGTPGQKSEDPRMQGMIDLYDAEIRYLDREIGSLIAFLKDRGVYEDLSIVIVADHGEQFMERGHSGHGFNLHDEELRVPFFIKTALVSSPRVVSLTVNTIDLYPTTLKLAGLLPPRAVPGVSMLDERALGERRGVYSEIIRKEEQERAFTTPDGIKIIMRGDSPESDRIMGVFNSKKDPGETHPINDSELALSLEGELREVRQYALDNRVVTPGETGATARGQMKNSTVENLKTLGYLQ